MNEISRCQICQFCFNIKENQNFKEFLFFPVMAIMCNAVNAIKLIDTNHVKGQTTFQPDPLKF